MVKRHKMSNKQGLTLPGNVFPNPKELQILFQLNVRLSITFKVTKIGQNFEKDISIEGEQIEYHFISSKPDNKINCVFCKSIFGDFIGLCGLTYTFDEFVKFYSEYYIYKNNITFEKTRIALFPNDWYACFEKDVFDKRWRNSKHYYVSKNICGKRSRKRF